MFGLFESSSKKNYWSLQNYVDTDKLMPIKIIMLLDNYMQPAKLQETLECCIEYSKRAHLDETIQIFYTLFLAEYHRLTVEPGNYGVFRTGDESHLGENAYENVPNPDIELIKVVKKHKPIMYENYKKLIIGFKDFVPDKSKFTTINGGGGSLYEFYTDSVFKLFEILNVNEEDIPSFERNEMRRNFYLDSLMQIYSLDFDSNPEDRRYATMLKSIGSRSLPDDYLYKE